MPLCRAVSRTGGPTTTTTLHKSSAEATKRATAKSDKVRMGSVDATSAYATSVPFVLQFAMVLTNADKLVVAKMLPRRKAIVAAEIPATIATRRARRARRATD